MRSKTLSNAREIEAQSTLICDRIQRPKSSSPASILEAVNQFKKGAEKISHEMISKEMAGLRRVAEATTERKSRKRKYIRTEETLTIGEVLDLIAPEKAGKQEKGEEEVNRAREKRHCGRCAPAR